jgi:hypothetical protein
LQLAAVAGTANALLDQLARRVESYDSLHALLAIARSLQVIRGRKAIVYFAEGRRLPEGAEPAYDTLVSEANRANVTIHTVDAGGLTAVRSAARGPIDSILDQFSAQSATRGTETGQVAAALTGRPVVDRFSGRLLARLAWDTGGVAIADRNDLGGGLTGVAYELGHYYEIVYVPSNPARDGRFRHIEVRVSRPGVTVRTRSGYFATTDTPPTLLPSDLPVLTGETRASVADRPPLKSAAGTHPQRVEAELVPLLERAGRYVTDYETDFRDIVAEETYTQWTEARQANPTLGTTVPAQRRVTRADMVFVRLGGDLPWGSFRDVFEVDGQPVRDRDARLEKLFRERPASAVERARAILLESARYNLGPATRTYNIPTLALAFLHPRNQGRFSFKRGGHRRIGGFDGVEVEFEETSVPTLVSTDRNAPGNLPARGRFWIDATRGTVLRSEVRLTIGSARFSAFVATQYGPEPGLAIWIPTEMKEECRDLPGGYRFGTLTATARYSNFRRFTVTVEEKAEVPNP